LTDNYKMNKYPIFFIIFINLNIFSQVNVSFYYQNYEYKFDLTDKNDILLDKPYNALNDIDSAQYFRITVTTIEESRLKNLSYAGNSAVFNGIEIKKIDNGIYSIRDISNDYKINFGIGEIQSIVIYSCLDFGKKGIDIYDRIATVISVKNLLKRFSVNPEKGIKVPEIMEKNKFENEIIYKIKSADDMLLMSKMYSLDEKSGQYRLTALGKTPEMKYEIAAILDKISFKDEDMLYMKKRIEEYANFINSIKKIDVKDRFDYLKRYIELNFQITFDKELLSPSDLYFFRAGNHKSVSFFYYDILKNLGMKVNSYLVTDLKKRPPEEISEISGLNANEKEELIMNYKNVRPAYNLNSLTSYAPPDFNSSVYIVALQTGKKWIYTTGEKWVDSGIFTPERCCSDYTKKGCYYSLIINDDIYNYPLKADDVKWDVFFETK
jgi:hypothetical protein